MTQQIFHLICRTVVIAWSVFWGPKLYHLQEWWSYPINGYVCFWIHERNQTKKRFFWRDQKDWQTMVLWQLHLKSLEDPHFLLLGPLCMQGLYNQCFQYHWWFDVKGTWSWGHQNHKSTGISTCPLNFGVVKLGLVCVGLFIKGLDLIQATQTYFCLLF